MNDNLKTWNMVKQPPQNALKRIDFGYLKGKSDINPQWRLMAMTQAFGMVGHGWTYRIARTWSEKCENGSVMCFSEVAVKTKLDGQWGEEFFGIGGSEIVEKNKNGKPLKAFEYKDKGSMATIGRNKAVVDLPKFHFHGVFAWFVWMFVHLISLIGFKNKAVVFLNWVYNYIRFDREARLIIRTKKKKMQQSFTTDEV